MDPVLMIKQRRTRSIVVICYAMYYTLTHNGLAALFCVKDPDGKWVLSQEKTLYCFEDNRFELCAR